MDEQKNNTPETANDDGISLAPNGHTSKRFHSGDATPPSSTSTTSSSSSSSASTSATTEGEEGAAPGDDEGTSIHPLQNSWTLWFDNPRKRTSVDTWGSHIKKVMEFATVEDFWRLYNNIMRASVLDHGSNYHLFKDGIEPKWEDPANERGGQWTLIVPHRERRERLDELWLWSMLAAIGEVLETEGEEEQVCGCVVSIRKSQDRITVWTKNAAMEGRVRAIGEKWKRLLDLPRTTTIAYQAHADSMKNRSISRYEV